MKNKRYILLFFLCAITLMLHGQSFSTKKFNILNYGADPNGVKSSTIAIQKAINAAYSIGGGEVIIPRGTYLLTGTKGAFKSIIEMKSNVTISGEGKESILKVGNNIFDFNVFSALDTSYIYRLEYVCFQDFSVDCNGANNILKGKRNLSKNAAIHIRRGSNIKILNVHIYNNAGNQSICIGNNTFPFTVQNVEIANCSFTNVGKNVKNNNLQTDHSAIYIQGDRCVIRNNRFFNKVYKDDATAIEAHVSNSIVKNNYSNNYATGLNIVATVTNMENVIFTDNIFENVDRGILFYLFKDFNMRNVIVKKNQFKQIDNKRPIIDLSINVQKPIKSVELSDNYIVNLSKFSMIDTPAVWIGNVESLKILNNKFGQTLGVPLKLSGSNYKNSTIEIMGNTFSGKSIGKKRHASMIDMPKLIKVKKLINQRNSIQSNM